MAKKQIDKHIIENIKEYGNEIKSLETFRDAVRENIGMYIGNRGNVGFINMIREVFQNSLDELMKHDSPCNRIIISYDERNHTVIIEDNGRGVPFNKMMDVYAKQHTSSNYNKKLGEYSSGKHGVGAKVTAALSDFFEACSYILGKAMKITFKDGYVTGDVVEIENPGKQGTVVTFHPDYNAMGYDITVTCKDVLDLIQSMLLLTNIGAVVDFNGILMDGTQVHEHLVNEDGIIGDLILRTDAPVVKPIMLSADTGELKVELAFTYDATKMDGGEQIRNFSNFCPMSGGKHVDGFIEGVCRFFSTYMNKVYLANTNSKSKKKPIQVTFGDVRTGLIGIIHACALHPIFGGQAKDTLENVEMKDFVKDVIMKGLDDWSKNNASDLQKVCKYLKEVAEIRNKADKEKVKISTKFANSNLTGGLPSKYIEPTGTEDLELIIVEGDSALGSARNSRDKTKQGIFPIRGKMPNPVNTLPAKYLANEEVRGIIAIIGGGYGKNFDINKVKFKRIIIMADADPDRLCLCA